MLVNIADHFRSARLHRQAAEPPGADGVNFVTYPSSVKLELMTTVTKENAENPGIYPTEDVKKKLFPDQMVDASTERVRTRTWTTIKTGQ